MTDVRNTVHYSPTDDETTFVRTQDVEPYLDWNKMLRDQRQKSDWGKHVASVPVVIIEQWLNEAWTSGNRDLQFGSEEWRQLVWKKLQDPDYKFLRVD